MQVVAVADGAERRQLLIYAMKRPDPLPGVFGFHEIWHLFVIAGSLCHYVAVARYLI